MLNDRYIKYSEYLLSGLFPAGVFIFYAFFFNSHLHFEEQFQLFLLSDDFLIERLKLPGGLTGYVGDFLTQFYYITLAGPAIIAITLFAFQQIVKKLLETCNPEKVLHPLSFIPPILASFILFNEFYPLSSVIGTIFASLGGWLYVSVRTERTRFVTGLFLIPLMYWLAAGASICMILIMLTGELLRLNSDQTGSLNRKIVHLFVFAALITIMAIISGRLLILKPGFNSLMGNFYYNKLTVVPVMILILFLIIPGLMILVFLLTVRKERIRIMLLVQIILILFLSYSGVRVFANFEAEEIMTYDFLVRNCRWGEVLKYAERKPPRNFRSLSMLNLALAKTGQMGNRMFNYEQHGINGLFLPFENEYVAPMLGNEIFYQLGLINASQEYVFESMETIPDMDNSARAIKRLAETNLINGQYGVSEKYLRLLQKTIFYRKWAQETLSYLGKEDKIKQNPAWSNGIKFAVRSDYFFHVENIEASLNRMVKEHPDNRIAFEYLMAFYLIRKDLRNVANLIPQLESLRYSAVPVSYQEALLYIIALNGGDPFTDSPAYISEGLKSRMAVFFDIYGKDTDAEERLRKNFGATYWYYLFYNREEIN
jgi:hypothetical protein